MSKTSPVSAAMVAIGDELLSGRTKDRNIAYLAEFLTIKGIALREVRIVGDESAAIIEAINALRPVHDYVFTSGGIGPTHDDITSEAVAKAFGVEIDSNITAYALLEAHYKNRKMPFTPARQKMARMPVGAKLIDNPVSVAPGFIVENVHVMAGVPEIFKAMILSVEPALKGGKKLFTTNIECSQGEGTIGDELATIAAAHPAVSIGSYPRFDFEGYKTQIVVTSSSRSAMNSAAHDINVMLAIQ